ncbi:MAG: 4Fe-4S binding protein [Euryarchaeota archaeon]|nr:4Fe-4S binding protein [Euryarchaeota archaeon]MBT3653587.1 4Fe-4S binding protein [Euryarchaeota archaeon]MBT3757144.1 4Fe-4S binding protein [Euryarchaeota archaeon]MBT4051079.1 4Fe-4S binding protein [Euryarchaeota archaeon]MBT4346368.1 4Fe-4S binding protein [Euryarchaeota archaeon]
MKNSTHTLLINNSRCFGCAACVAICPLDALSLNNILIDIEENKCTHCELCLPICPVFAIEIR